ncbi:MAG: efflux RND transporter periplasmic adaptor subunit [Planctomycetota bacterium]
MRRLLFWLVLLVMVGVGVGAAYRPVAEYWRKRNLPSWRQVEVTRGRIVSVVNATGNVKPVVSISVGAFVSGPIEKLNVEFNQEVKEGEILAEIDPLIYDAAVKREGANVKTREADVQRARALWQQSINDWNRVAALREEDETFVAQAEMDKFRFTRDSLEAQLRVAEAAVIQAQASLDNAEAQLSYTKIRAPVDGMIINRKIDKGQTLASQFQTPELFVIAPDMRRKMHIHASVDEADIGLIRAAQQQSRRVEFTVDAYPYDLFAGQIEEIRLSSSTTQNVVTYPVIVSAPNPDLKLLPGMTASISFEIDDRKDVIRIPNAALRFYPQPKLVRPEDRNLLEGKGSGGETEQPEATDIGLSATERTEARRQRNQRHVWVADGEFLRAVAVVTGLSDSQTTELVSGELEPGEKLVTGLLPKTGW